MFELFKISLVYPFLFRPLKLFVYFMQCLFLIKKWKNFFDQYEDLIGQNRVLFLKTVYVNFRSLPFCQAKKIPIYVFNDVQIISLRGCMSILSSNIYSGMIRWGWFHTFRSQGKTRINNRGEIIFRGPGKIIKGAEIMVKEKAVLSMGREFFIGENCMIYCWESVCFGDYVRVTYHGQVFDSDFHFSVNTETGEVARRTKPIIIGNYNWIGNKAIIKKGVITPNHLTVAASNSLLTKDYSKIIPEYSIIGGAPVRLLATGYSRIWNKEFARIREIDKWFEEHPNEKYFKYDVKEKLITDYTENE